MPKRTEFTTLKDLPPEAREKFREQCRKGGLAPRPHAARVKAGKAGMAARLKKLAEAAGQAVAEAAPTVTPTANNEQPQ